MGARREAREALAAAGLRPRRRFGQHFLCDPTVVRRIVDEAKLDPGAAVLEIGPGLGALTDALVERAGRLYLVEIDRGLAGRLTERYAGRDSVRVLAGDVLALPLAELVDAPEACVVANLPYNVSTPVLFRLLALRARFPRAVLMLQREVAVRLAASPGSAEWGVLPVLVQTWGAVRLAFAVSRRSFLPTPRVDSAVVTIAWRRDACVPLGDPDTYRAVVRAAFGQRRKMLRNALAALATGAGAAADALLEEAGIDPRARAETLTLDDFGRLACALAAVRRPAGPG